MSERHGVCRVVTTSLSARLLLAGQMRAMGEVEWAVVSGDPWPAAPPEIEVHEVPMRRELSWSDVRALRQLRQLFRRRRFRLVQTHTPKASLLGLPAARLSGTPTAYTVHGALYFAGNSRVRNIPGWVFERWCSTWADIVLLQCREDLQALADAHVCPAGKLRYIGNGIDLEHFTEQPVEQRARLSVVMVSRLVAEKGCRDYLELARRLRHTADFSHAGPVEHDQRDALTEAEMDSARADGIKLLGELSDVRPLLANADVVVLPSYREGIPRAAMEAAATGRPVVAYDIRGVREVVPHGMGLLVPVGDVDALTTAVRRLLENTDLRLEAGARCAEQVRSSFSEDHVARRLRAVYQEMGVL